MATLSLAQIRATQLGTSPWKEIIDALVDHVDQNQQDIGAVQGGGTPGWNSSIDTRWTQSETSSSATAYTVTVPDAAGEALFDGFFMWLEDINQANSGTLTIDVGTTDGAITVKKLTSTGALVDVDAGDTTPNMPAMLTYTSPYFILHNPLSQNRTIHISASAPAGGDGYNGDVWLQKE